jgi:hypothetical protein
MLRKDAVLDAQNICGNSLCSSVNDSRDGAEGNEIVEARVGKDNAKPPFCLPIYA